jgi:hypothetical protein
MPRPSKLMKFLFFWGGDWFGEVLKHTSVDLPCRFLYNTVKFLVQDWQIMLLPSCILIQLWTYSHAKPY